MSVAAGGENFAHGDFGPATQARLNHPSGATVDAAGNLYIADRDNHRIRRVSPDGTISTIAGTGVAGNGGDGGPATNAQLNTPNSVALDATGNLYIADTGNSRVRVLSPDGRIRGATALGLVSPVYAIADAAGNIYISDDAQGKILKAGPNGVPAVVLSGLKSPHGLAFDATGNLYFAEAGAAQVRRWGRDGSLKNLGAGNWNIPRGIAVDSSGRIFVADTGLQQVLRIDPSGQITAVAGTGAAGFSGDGGSGEEAQLSYPWDVAVGPNQSIAIADLDNNRIRMIKPAASAVLFSPLADAVNAASLITGPIAPGTLVLLRNTGLSPIQIPDTQILFGSVPAQIISASASGILVLAPSGIAGMTAATIDVSYQGALLGVIPATVADAAPALFVDSSGRAAVTNADGSLNSPGNPAARGSVISLYGTGFGISGAPISVNIGGYSADVLYAGPVAGNPGLFQVNTRIPAGYLGPSDVSIMAGVGIASTQSAVRISID